MMPPAVSFPSPASPAADGKRRRVAVIGGGISGLAAAHRLTELAPATQVTLFEASDRLGGVLQTEQREGCLIERSADMFITRDPWAADLCRRVGLADELIGTNPKYRRSWVVCRGRLVPIPEGFTLLSPARVWPIVKTPILSPLGKLRLAWERFKPARQSDADESLETFVVRRFGREAFDRLIQPLIGGIYTADPAKLSMAATLPQFVEMERKFGSLIRGMRKQGTGERKQETGERGKEPASGARYGLFVAPRLGMQQWVDALAARLPMGCARLNAPVERIERDCSWRVSVAGVSTSESFDDLILAAPGDVSSRLLATVDAELASIIGRIEHAGCSVAILGYQRDQIEHPLDGFGFVVPAMERRQIIAGSLASVKFAGRAPEGKVLIRVFVGGALQPELGQQPDDQIAQIVRGELAALLGARGTPEFCDVVRWQRTMPQYHVGHLELVRQIEERAAAISNFALAGNAYRGVGIPLCVRSGEQAAERVVNAKMAISHQLS